MFKLLNFTATTGGLCEIGLSWFGTQSFSLSEFYFSKADKELARGLPIAGNFK